MAWRLGVYRNLIISMSVSSIHSHVPTESAMVGMHVIGRDRYSCQVVSCVEWSVIINYRVPEITVTPLLTWFNFNPSMDKDHTPAKVLDKITYPFPNFNGANWSLGMDKYFHATLDNGYNNVSLLKLKLIHVSKMGPRCTECKTQRYLYEKYRQTHNGTWIQHNDAAL